MPVISAIQKYASYALLVALLVCSGTIAYLWHGKGVSEALVKDLSHKNAELSASLQAERDWSEKLSTELANRKDKQSRSDAERKQTEDKLDKSYEKNRGWADAPVPVDTSDGLREYLNSR